MSIDGWLLFSTRCARLFAYGLLSVVLMFYLAAVGLSEAESGLLLTLTLVGDIVISLWLTTHADRLGRRRMLMIGGLLMVFAAVLFALTSNFWLLLLAATVGVISPSGNEVGPFLPIEQAALAQTLAPEHRTGVFSWYNLVGSLATALGSLSGGLIAQFMQGLGYTGTSVFTPLLIIYGGIGLSLVILFAFLSPAAEIGPDTPRPKTALGLHRSRKVVLRLSALFALDAFGGGFIIQTILSKWFAARFGAEFAQLGGIFFAANILAGISALAAARVAKRIGLVNTMVFTHLPSNILLILIPLAPNLPLAIALLLLRFSISQMDVPARQSYTVAVVSPDERSAASGVTGVARSVGASIAPYLATLCVANPPLLGMPFFLAGGIKIVYDLLLFRGFRTLAPPEEIKPAPPAITEEAK